MWEQSGQVSKALESQQNYIRVDFCLWCSSRIISHTWPAARRNPHFHPIIHLQLELCWRFHDSIQIYCYVVHSQVLTPSTCAQYQRTYPLQQLKIDSFSCYSSSWSHVNIVFWIYTKEDGQLSGTGPESCDLKSSWWSMLNTCWTLHFWKRWCTLQPKRWQNWFHGNVT